MSKGNPTQEEMQTRVERTKKLMKAGAKLRDYRDRIDDALKAIGSEQFHSEIANDCIDIGIGLQDVSSIIRRLSVEGEQKAKKKVAKSEWTRLKDEMNRLLGTEEYQEWLDLFSVKIPKYSHGKGDRQYFYYGPSENFMETYIKSEDDNT